MTTKLGTLLEPFFGRRAAAPVAAPRADVSSSDPRLLEFFGLQRESSGVYVTEQSAMTIAAVWACVRLIAGTVALLPVNILREHDGIQEPAPRDDLWWMLNEQPSEMWTAASAWEWVTQSMLLRGDGFMEIVRPSPGSLAIRELRPLDPDRVQIIETANFGVRYRIARANGTTYDLWPADVLHFAGPGFNGLRSPSAIRHYARRAISIALATDEFSAKFFGSGALSRHAIKAPHKITPELADELRRQWAERYAGLDNAYRPLVLSEGLDVKELSLSAEDSQLIESRQFQVIDIARAFGVPPILIQETEKTSSWGTGVEQIIIGFVRFTMAPHLERFRDELNRKLFLRAGRAAEFDTDALTRPDSKGFGELLRNLVGGSQGPGIITVNEARSALRRPPKPRGDELYDPKVTPDAQPEPLDDPQSPEPGAAGR